MGFHGGRAQAYATHKMPESTTFNADGSITTVYGPPLNATVTTSFDPSGSIVESFGPPIGNTRTTTFGTDGSISQGVS